MQSHKMTSMKASSYRRVSPDCRTNMLQRLPTYQFPRRDGDPKHVVSLMLCALRVTSALLRAILHDPATYPEPDMFKPERFLNTDGSLRDDPTLISVFGYGKRICPGRHVADATLFMSIASLLSVFNIKKGRGGWDKLSSYTFTGALAK